MLRCIIATAVILVACTVAQAAKRVALVIGNSDYQHASKLPNPRNDARDMAAAFDRLGFEVTRLDNLGFGEMRRTLGEFSDNAFGADMAVVFYAGHGMEVNKQNYLIPTDARLATDRAISYEAVPLELVTEAVSGAKGLKLVMLDACRNNPFAASMELTNPNRSIGRGLARVEPVAGTLVSFAAKEGTVASDGDGDNSPYTEALLEHLEEPGLEINFLFRKVRDKVMEQTSNQQQPFTYGSLPAEEIFLVGTPRKPAIAPSFEEQTAALRDELEALRARLNEATTESKRPAKPPSQTAKDSGTETQASLPEGPKFRIEHQRVNEQVEREPTKSRPAVGEKVTYRIGPLEVVALTNKSGLLVSRLHDISPTSGATRLENGKWVSYQEKVEPGDRIVNIEQHGSLDATTLPGILDEIKKGGARQIDITVIKKRHFNSPRVISVAVPLEGNEQVGTIGRSHADNGNLERRLRLAKFQTAGSGNTAVNHRDAAAEIVELYVLGYRPAREILDNGAQDMPVEFRRQVQVFLREIHQRTGRSAPYYGGGIDGIIGAGSIAALKQLSRDWQP